MGTYVQVTDLPGIIPNPFLVQALDDTQAGVIDNSIWALIQAQVGNDINARIGQRYPVPFTSTIPAIVSSAALVLAAEAIYARRVQPDANPFTARAAAMRTKLDRIGQGDEPLTPDLNRKDPSGNVIGSRAATAGRSRTMF